MADDPPAGSSDRVDPDGDGRDETPTERLDRNWSELLQELRVTQTGIQVLAGFLLTLPFQQRFAALSPFLHGVFLVAVALSTTTTVLVVAPVSAHRILFRRHEKDVLVRDADRLAKAGLVALALTVVAVVLLVYGLVGGTGAGVAAAAVALALFLVVWLVVPVRAIRRDPPVR